MKQVILLSLFVTGVYASTAQNISPAGFFATNIAEIKLPVVAAAVSAEVSSSMIMHPPAYFLGDRYKGVWISYYANGNRCDSGLLINNLPDGLWKNYLSCQKKVL